MNRHIDLRCIARLLLAGALALSGGPTSADDQAQPSKVSKPEKGRNRAESGETTVGHVPELRDETFRLMDAYLISNLQESLGLTDEQFARAMPLVKKLQSDRRDFAKRRMQALRMLRRTLQSGSATEAGVADLLKEVKTVSTEERAATVGNVEALDAVLTPLQQAKYRVFEAEVDIRLRHLLARSQDKDRQPNR
ncbi:MAG: hypothetical protein ABI565_07975 [Vicinamibacteria bacterium]